MTWLDLDRGRLGAPFVVWRCFHRRMHDPPLRVGYETIEVGVFVVDIVVKAGYMAEADIACSYL